MELQTITPTSIRFTQEEKSIIQRLAQERQQSITSFVREALSPVLKENKKSKIEKLLELKKKLDIPQEVVEKAFEDGEEMRKNFKLTRED